MDDLIEEIKHRLSGIFFIIFIVGGLNHFINKDIQDYQIVAKKRIGIHYAGDDANFLWRFYIKGNKYISKK